MSIKSPPHECEKVLIQDPIWSCEYNFNSCDLKYEFKGKKTKVFLWSNQDKKWMILTLVISALQSISTFFLNFYFISSLSFLMAFLCHISVLRLHFERSWIFLFLHVFFYSEFWYFWSVYEIYFATILYLKGFVLFEWL